MKKVLMLLFVTVMFCFGQYSQQEIKQLERECDSGICKSCYSLGFNYNIGFSGLKKDFDKADKYFIKHNECQEKECDNNNYAGSCLGVGNRYADGYYGIKKDVKKAAQYFSKYTQQMDKECNDEGYSCFLLGNFYYYGNQIVKKDIKKATQYFNEHNKHREKKCSNGDVDYCYTLSFFYENGGHSGRKVIEPNQNKALEYHKKVCDLDPNYYSKFTNTGKSCEE
jgi:TPR repeat protein